MAGGDVARGLAGGAGGDTGATRGGTRDREAADEANLRGAELAVGGDALAPEHDAVPPGLAAGAQRSGGAAGNRAASPGGAAGRVARRGRRLRLLPGRPGAGAVAAPAG